MSSKESVSAEGDRSYLDGKPSPTWKTTSRVLPHVLRSLCEMLEVSRWKPSIALNRCLCVQAQRRLSWYEVIASISIESRTGCLGQDLGYQPMWYERYVRYSVSLSGFLTIYMKRWLLVLAQRRVFSFKVIAGISAGSRKQCWERPLRYYRMCYEHHTRHYKSLGGWNNMFEQKPLNTSSKKHVMM